MKNSIVWCILAKKLGNSAINSMADVKIDIENIRECISILLPIGNLNIKKAEFEIHQRKGYILHISN